MNATKQGVLIISDGEGVPIACVIRNSRHFVHYTLKEMNEDDIESLFKGEEKKDFRLSLTNAVASVLKNGLYLLGIEAPERM